MSTETPEAAAADDFFCPHLDVVDEETLQQLFSKVAAVRSENKELFEFTHRRIKVYRSITGASTDTEVVPEEEVYNQFKESRVGNFAVVIEGEVGTGKSELCAYLAHRLREEADRPILHVDKDDDLMTILSDRIPEFHREQFGEELPEASNFQQLRDDIENNPQTIANNATSGAILNLKQRGYEVAVPPETETKIREFIQEKLQLLVEKGEYAREIKFITHGEFAQEEYLDIFTTNVDEDDAIAAFNEELWREIRDRYQTSSLGDVLQKVGSKFEDTRPVIIFEDFAITAMEAQKLRNYMERDKKTDNWDFIAAGTRDSTEVLHTQTAEDRFEFYQTNKRNSNNVLFLDEKTAVDFIRPYLGYFKSFDNSVRYERDADGSISRLKEAPAGSRCAECGFCDESFRDLFPFNEVFLERVYAGLNESEQSPREYVMKVFDVLEEYYSGITAVPSSSTAIRPLVNRISAADAVYETAEEFAQLARWYGREDGDEIVVDRRFATAFGLVTPDSNDDDLPDPIALTPTEIRVPTSGFGVTPTPLDEEQTADTSNSSTDNEEPKEAPGTTKSPVEQEIEEHAPLVESWLDSPSEFTQTDVYIRRGLTDALERLTDGFALYEGTSLEYNLSSQKHPFVYPGSTEAPDADQIMIDPTEFRLSDLRSILQFGIYREMDARGADYGALLEKCGTQLTGYANEWRQQLTITYLNADDILYKRHATYDFQDFVLASYAQLMLVDSPWKELSAAAINDRYGNGADYSIDSDVAMWISEEMAPDEAEAIQSMMSYAEYIEEMMGEFSGVSGSNLDVRRLKRWLSDHQPSQVLKLLGRGYINNIDSRVRFSNGPTLKTVGHAAYDFQRALDDLAERGYDADVVTEIHSLFENFDMDRVEPIVNRLETYDDVHPDVLEALNRFTQLTQSDIDAAVSAAELARDLKAGDYSSSNGLQAGGTGLTEQATLHAALISLKLEHSRVYRRVSEVQFDNGSEVETLGETFKRVGEFYVQ